ncbi:MAG: hypothetical protein B6244_03205 [Candidatus Cloacimonetes bacterium 4572_55]|nr:MAG: hypothetical protein B6244_03205 [Candidatus Cloacimonetes bacterium 4572_55]
MLFESDILYIDNHLLVVNKHAGHPTQADISGDLDLLSEAKAYLKKRFDKPGDVFLGLVHRLDRPVSGAIIFARTSKAASRLFEQFQKRTVQKHYLTIVEGRCVGAGIWKDYLVKKQKRVKVSKPSHPRAKFAELKWETIGYQSSLSLLRIELTTGRPHQIRAQAAHRGFPIQGDLRYGAKRKFDGRNIGLHCYRLGITHPVKKEPLSWQILPTMSIASWQRFKQNVRPDVIDREFPLSLTSDDPVLLK